jgi:hypothetical protein
MSPRASVILRVLLEGPENGPESALGNVRHNGAMARPINPNIRPATEARVQADHDKVDARLAAGIKHCPKCSQAKPIGEF